MRARHRPPLLRRRAHSPSGPTSRRRGDPVPKPRWLPAPRYVPAARPTPVKRPWRRHRPCPSGGREPRRTTARTSARGRPGLRSHPTESASVLHNPPEMAGMKCTSESLSTVSSRPSVLISPSIATEMLLRSCPFLEQSIAQRGMGGRQIPDDLAHGRATNLDFLGVASQRLQHRWNEDRRHESPMIVRSALDSPICPEFNPRPE